jgi:transposase
LELSERLADLASS